MESTTNRPTWQINKTNASDREYHSYPRLKGVSPGQMIRPSVTGAAKKTANPMNMPINHFPIFNRSELNQAGQYSKCLSRSMAAAEFTANRLSSNNSLNVFSKSFMARTKVWIRRLGSINALLFSHLGTTSGEHPSTNSAGRCGLSRAHSIASVPIPHSSSSA